MSAVSVEFKLTNHQGHPKDCLGEYLFGSVLEKLVFFSSNFRDIGKVLPLVFGAIECRFRYKKRPSTFSERQQQLINLGKNITFPCLKVQPAYPNRYMLLSV